MTRSVLSALIKSGLKENAHIVQELTPIPVDLKKLITGIGTTMDHFLTYICTFEMKSSSAFHMLHVGDI